jgi:type II secretory pathway predicted ATPase ExeA
MSMLDDLYLPDKKRLTVQLVGRPGSGKSYMLKKTLDAFLKQNEDEDLRILYICPKHEFTY